MKEKTPHNSHYSDKGGHEERSRFWNLVTSAVSRNPELKNVPPREAAWLGIRNMRRIPNSGRK